VVVGNEVLDAMPVQLLARVKGQWFERGVVRNAGNDGWTWADRATDLRPPVDVPGEHDYLTEIHPQARAFIATLADRLNKGAAFLIDYGFPESEYYHPQRHMGTVMCHRAHQADGDPLSDVGYKDITAHVDFTGIALAGQDAGLAVLGYTSQARFLLNCGLLARRWSRLDWLSGRWLLGSCMSMRWASCSRCWLCGWRTLGCDGVC
jgi:SAM-dependent MidA family methyltransferase